MTKVDEGAAVPRIGAAERGRLSRALDREHVVAGTLFGSQATGKAGPLSDVDIVVLNGAPPLLRHRALKSGTRLIDRDPRARVRLETAALLDYLDTAPLRETLAAGRRRRIKEGRFGRR